MNRVKRSNNLEGNVVYTAYVPHGVSKKFKPIPTESAEFKQVTELKEKLGISDKKFVVLWNNRNIRRKNPGDVILSYKEMCDGMTKEEANECVLLLHTAPSDPNGTDIPAVIDELCPDYDVVFTHSQFSTDDLNVLYNVADVTLNIASNEGFGLATCESMRAGTPIIVNVTGGMQDHCRFTKDGKFITADDYIKLGSLHNHKELPENLGWGRWVKPVWPTNRSLQGSIATPYIFDDRCSFEDVGKVLRQWYDMDEPTRKECGLEGSVFVESDESGMSAENMGARFIDSMGTALNNWKPRNEIVLWKL